MIQQDIKAASAANYSCLFIGQDRRGHWIVKDAQSLCGGLFTNRTEAIRFAMYECQRRPQSVIMLPNGLELEGLLDTQNSRTIRRSRARPDERRGEQKHSRSTRRQPSVAAAGWPLLTDIRQMAVGQIANLRQSYIVAAGCR
jgi:hypothetical protein